MSSRNACGHLRRIGKSLVVDRRMVDGKAGCFKPGHWLGDRRVLDRAGDDMPRRRLGTGQAEDARLLASVPPEVKITSAGSAPRICATVSLESSQARRADRPKACRLSALPAARKYGRIASSTSGSKGVVAL